MAALSSAVKLKNHYDLVVIGGGINGTTILREAASRGLKALLCQANDLATGYSSSQPYFIGPNLSQLRNGRFDKLAKDYSEVSRLNQIAQHLMQPSTAVECFGKHWTWPLLNSVHRFWQQPVKKPDIPSHLLPSGLVHKSSNGYRIQSNRFILANALQAAQYGAQIATRHEITQGHREHGAWQLHIQQNNGARKTQTVTAKILINATGPHVHKVLDSRLQSETRAETLLLRLSHLIVANKLKLDNAIFFNTEGQRFGLTPINSDWLHFGPLTLTTVDEITNEQIAEDQHQLLQQLNQFTQDSFTADDIAQCRTGQRAVCNDGDTFDLAELMLDIECPDGQSPLVNLFGGDVLHHLLTGDQVMRLLSPYLPNHTHPSKGLLPLPGANFSDLNSLTKQLKSTYSSLPDSLLYRLRNTYGDISFDILGKAKTVKDLGRDFGHQLHRAEVDYLIEKEWAQTATDILERRTSLSWDYTAAQAQDLEDYISGVLAG